MVFKNRCILVFWTNVASALEGLSWDKFSSHSRYKSLLYNVNDVFRKARLLDYSDNVTSAYSLYVVVHLRLFVHTRK